MASYETTDPLKVRVTYIRLIPTGLISTLRFYATECDRANKVLDYSVPCFLFKNHVIRTPVQETHTAHSSETPEILIGLRRWSSVVECGKGYLWFSVFIVRLRSVAALQSQWAVFNQRRWNKSLSLAVILRQVSPLHVTNIWVCMKFIALSEQTCLIRPSICLPAYSISKIVQWMWMEFGIFGDLSMSDEFNWIKYSLSRWQLPCYLRYELSSPIPVLVRIQLDAWMSVYILLVLSCVGIGLVTGWSPVQGVLPTVYRIKKLKKQPRPGKKTVEPLTIINNMY
jgi:hypothetical protein